MEEQKTPEQIEVEETPEQVEVVLDTPIPFVREYSQFDAEHYRTLSADKRAEYISSLINHTEQFSNLWCLSLPLDITGTIVSEICRGKLFENADSKIPLEIVKSNYSKSGKSWVICWAKNSNISNAIFKF